MSIKEQFGFRLDRSFSKKLDDHAATLGQSRNFVIEQCIEVGFPMISDPAFYEAILTGISRTEIATICADRLREVVAERKGKKKG